MITEHPSCPSITRHLACPRWEFVAVLFYINIVYGRYTRNAAAATSRNRATPSGSSTMIALIILMARFLPHACILTIWTLLTSPSRLNTFAQFYATKFSLHYPCLITSPTSNLVNLICLRWQSSTNLYLVAKSVSTTPLFLTLL